MADTARRAAPALDPGKELQALTLLKESIADACKDDPDLLLDMAEGETSIMDVIDKLLEADLVDQGLVEGLANVKAIVKLREERFEMRIKTRRTILEQALLLLERKKLERPTATVTMTERAPTVEVDDESAVPSAYFKTKLSLDKKALNDAYKALLAKQDAEIATAKSEGREPEFFPMIEGCRVTNGSVSLTVRRK
jgi:hypothetical protein